MDASSKAIAALLDSIDEMTKADRTSAGGISDLAAATAAGKTGLQEVSQDVKTIAEESAGLVEINTVIRKIARDTNLLSMNAAIEAAHAGSTGAGFAVVAEEIRKLAFSANQQSKTINDVLKKISASITKIADATEKVLTQFSAIDEQVQGASNEETKILSLMSQQNDESRRTLDLIKNLGAVTEIVKKNSTLMLTQSRQVADEDTALSALTNDLSQGVTDAASGARAVNASMEKVESISQQNRQGVAALRTSIAHFVLMEKAYQWDDSLVLGISQIDQQHKELVKTVDGLLSKTSCANEDELRHSLIFLSNYVDTHFRDEEAIQKRIGYPRFAEHHRIHEAFKKSVRQLIKQFKDEGASSALLSEVRSTAGDWLITHIKGEDMRIRDYIQKTGQTV
jgi:hemerythrin-like metal-binding protein